MWEFLEEWLFGVDREQDIEKFFKNFPEIDIRQIIEKVAIFNQIVQSSDLEKLEQSKLVFDENLKKNFRQAIVKARFLDRYSFRSIFPLNNYIDLLQDDTVRIHMKYRKREYKNKKYFSYYLIFKQFEHDWIIVESNLYNKVQLRQWGILFCWLLLAFIVVAFQFKWIP